jgi:hypothetical protein
MNGRQVSKTFSCLGEITNEEWRRIDNDCRIADIHKPILMYLHLVATTQDWLNDEHVVELMDVDNADHDPGGPIFEA